MIKAEKEKTYIDIENLYSFLNILKIVSDIDSFRSWVKSTHKLKNDDQIFFGYQFFIDVVFSRIIHQFERYSSFGIEYDYSMYRASFVGVHIDDIPVTCEEVKLLKNLWNNYRPVRKSKNWNELTIQLKERTNPLFLVFDRIFNEAIESKATISKDDVLWGKTVYLAAIYLNDTRRGLPNAYPGSILDSLVNQNNYNKIFVGYVYTLQFLWSQLFPDDEFHKSPASKLHRVIRSEKFNKKRPTQFFGIFSNNPNSDEKDVWDEWQELDKFFSKIFHEIVERKIPLQIRQGELVLTEKYEKSMLSPLMHLSPISQPVYFTKQKSFEDWTKMLDSFFFWHEMDVLDTNKIHVFNGAFAFMSLLLGEAEKYKILNDTDPFWIARIKHPVRKNQNEISYGLLLQSGGWITDTSGWLLFLDCGNDYSGSGGYQAEKVEELVKKFEDEKRIIVKEISVTEEIFVRYLRQKEIPSLVQQIKVVSNEIIEQGIFDNNYPSLQSIVLENLRNISSDEISEISDQIEKIVFFLKLFIPDEQRFVSINEKIEQISETEDITKKLGIIASIVPLIPYVIENNQIKSIESKIDNLIIKKSPGLSSKIVISSGFDFMGSGAKHELEIPLSEISYDELSEDIKRLLQKSDQRMKQMPELKTQFLKFLSEGRK